MRSLEVELHLHALFLSPGLSQNAGAVISVFKKDFLATFWWVIPEEVAKGISDGNYKAVSA